MKVYLEQNGIKYYDYELILDDYSCDRVAIDEATRNRLDANFDSMLAPNVVPPINSPIYVAPDCPTPLDDIRKNYTVKRGGDAGDYNVFSPLTKSCGSRTLTAWAIIPSLKTVFGIVYSWIGSKITLPALIQSYYPHFDLSNVSLCSGTLHITLIPQNSEPWLKLLRGEYSKPCVSYKTLQFANTNDLTMDMIDLLYRTGHVRYQYNQEDLDKFVLQVKALNQCNWRDYPRALGILFCEILGRGTVCARVRSSTSGMSKSVKEILGTSFPERSTSKMDFEMGRAILDHFLGVENVRFTDAATLIDRLIKRNISLSTFSEFYGNIIKLTPKQYAE